MSTAQFLGWPVLCTQLAAMLCAHNEHLGGGRSLQDARSQICPSVSEGRQQGGGKPSGTL